VTTSIPADIAELLRAVSDMVAVPVADTASTPPVSSPAARPDCALLWSRTAVLCGTLDGLLDGGGTVPDATQVLREYAVAYPVTYATGNLPALGAATEPEPVHGRAADEAPVAVPGKDTPAGGGGEFTRARAAAELDELVTGWELGSSRVPLRRALRELITRWRDAADEPVYAVTAVEVADRYDPGAGR
jgi:hypothetical protein